MQTGAPNDVFKKGGENSKLDSSSTSPPRPSLDSPQLETEVWKTSAEASISFAGYLSTNAAGAQMALVSRDDVLHRLGSATSGFAEREHSALIPPTSTSLDHSENNEQHDDVMLSEYHTYSPGREAKWVDEKDGDDEGDRGNGRNGIPVDPPSDDLESEEWAKKAIVYLREKYVRPFHPPPLKNRVNTQLSDRSQITLATLQKLTNQLKPRDTYYDSHKRLLEEYAGIDAWTKEYILNYFNNNLQINEDVPLLLSNIIENISDVQTRLINNILEEAAKNLNRRDSMRLEIQDFAFGFDLVICQNPPCSATSRLRFLRDSALRLPETMVTTSQVTTSVAGHEMEPTIQAQAAEAIASTPQVAMTVSGHEIEPTIQDQVAEQQKLVEDLKVAQKAAQKKAKILLRDAASSDTGKAKENLVMTPSAPRKYSGRKSKASQGKISTVSNVRTRGQNKATQKDAEVLASTSTSTSNILVDAPKASMASNSHKPRSRVISRPSRYSKSNASAGPSMKIETEYGTSTPGSAQTIVADALPAPSIVHGAEPLVDNGPSGCYSRASSNIAPNSVGTTVLDPEESPFVVAPNKDIGSPQSASVFVSVHGRGRGRANTLHQGNVTERSFPLQNGSSFSIQPSSNEAGPLDSNGSTLLSESQVSSSSLIPPQSRQHKIISHAGPQGQTLNVLFLNKFGGNSNPSVVLSPLGGIPEISNLASEEVHVPSKRRRME